MVLDCSTLLAGASAGVVGTVLGYPLDTLKSRLATAATSGRSESIVSIVRALGFRGLYAGVGSPLVSLVILNTMGFSSFNGFTQLLGCKSGSSDDTSDKEIFQLEPRLMLAGGLSGLCASVISTPFELLKVQMQVRADCKFTSAWDVAKRVASTQGLRGLYTGFCVNTTREVPPTNFLKTSFLTVFLFCSTYFGVYEHGKRYLSTASSEECTTRTRHGDYCSSDSTDGSSSITATGSSSKNSSFNDLVNGRLPSSVAVPLAGGTSGCLAWFLSYPLDCVKSNLQGRHLVAPKPSDTPSSYSSGSSSRSSSGSLARGRNLAGAASPQSSGWNAPSKPSAWSVARHLVAMRGVRGLYSGLAPSLARAFVVSGSRFSAYEFALWALKQGKLNEGGR